ncbi:MAG: 3'-5' exonuclease [Magnetococcales bacterium]|nr:3'-5' exonuclease [Magnetococcales bacterium]
MVPFWWNCTHVLEFRRRWLLDHVKSGPLRDYLMTPVPSRRRPLDSLDFMALDLETTGLDAKRDEIISVGMVEMRKCRINLETSSHLLVNPQKEIPEESVILHGVTDDISKTGATLEEIMPRLLDALTGKVLVAHYARLEVTFLQAACRRLYGYPLVVPVVDTLRLESKRLKAGNRYPKAGDLRLDAVRMRYNLPRYRAHNALSDALSAAELFLAQVSHRAASGRMLTLGDLLR